MHLYIGYYVVRLIFVFSVLNEEIIKAKIKLIQIYFKFNTCNTIGYN